MIGELSKTDVQDIRPGSMENYKNIKPEKEMTVKELNDAINAEFNKIAKETEMQETGGQGEVFNSEVKENDYFSTYDERLKCTPIEGERGQWEGERGESKYIPSDPEIKGILANKGLDGIEYKDAQPEFSVMSKSIVEIEDMTENRAKNFKQCDEKCAEQWNKEAHDGKTDWTARDVKEWRDKNDHSWHERNDMKTCDLVPTKINGYFKHLGGVSECIKRDSSVNGGGFDE